MNNLLLDTTILIDLSCGSQASADFVDLNQGSGLAISLERRVNAIKLMVGC